MTGFIRSPSTQVADREPSATSTNRWFGSAPILAGTSVALFLWIVATCTALILYLILKPVPVPWLPEVVDLIGSVDTRIQRWAFLVTAQIFAVILAIALLIQPAPPRLLSIASAALCVRFDRAFGLARLSRVFNLPPPRWLARVVLSLCVAMGLTIFVLGQLHLSSSQGATLQVQAGDPHIYAIFGQAGETLIGRFSSSTSSQNLYAYGFGPAAIYAIGRHLGATATYFYAYQIARWSNLFVVLVLFGALFRPRLPRLGYLPTALIVLATAVVTTPLLFPSSYSAYAANLSGLRYMPMIFFIVSVGVIPENSASSSRDLITLAGFASLGLIYSVDVGIISLIAYIAFLGLQGGSIPNRLLKVLIFLGATATGFATIGLIFGEWLSVDFFTIAKSVASNAGNDFGGLTVQFSLRDSFIATLFVVTASGLVFSSIDRELDNEERFVAAIAIMGFVWYLYYLRRPGDLYWIFGYLALLNLRYWVGRTSGWGTPTCRVGAIGALAATAMLAQQSYTSLALGFDLERASRNKATLATTSELSGIRVTATFADMVTTQIKVLKQVGTRDSVVITGFPYLATTASNVANAPRDIVFSLTTTQKIDDVVALILKQRPSRVFLEPTHTEAWGPGLMQAVVHRIETGISGQYKRDEAISEWRVWDVQSQ
ncbi:hypothetical protein [Rhizobium sp. IBUN]|uniref:hypothetical protein n=1 Tax=Rhizobium sp. IBUN TaxID=1042326 RepID=UPI00042140DC|nr:hypothetical protein [Rhizobium sp. IBUN]